MAEMLECPLCGREIGKVIKVGSASCTPGPIILAEHKLDYRKASHLFWHGGRRVKSGMLCKRCAKWKCPEGRYYRVAFIYVRKKTHILSGDNGDVFFTREGADAAAAQMRERTGMNYWVEEFKA